MLPEHNEKYGKILERTACDNGSRTMQIAAVVHRGEKLIEFRSIYFRNSEPNFGQGIRIPFDMFEDAVLVAQAYYNEFNEETS